METAALPATTTRPSAPTSHRRTDGTTVARTGTDDAYATCTRRYDRDRPGDGARKRPWIARPDGAGVMCPTCQARQRRGQL